MWCGESSGGCRELFVGLNKNAFFICRDGEEQKKNKFYGRFKKEYNKYQPSLYLHHHTYTYMCIGMQKKPIPGSIWSRNNVCFVVLKTNERCWWWCNVWVSEEEGRNESNLWFFLISYKSPLYNIFTQFPIMKAINIIQYTAHVSNVVKDSVKSNKNLWCATMRRKHKSIKKCWSTHIAVLYMVSKVHVEHTRTHTMQEA